MVLTGRDPITFQVLDYGTNTYTYGLARISQQKGTTPEYFLADALGSVRQLTSQNDRLFIDFAKSLYLALPVS
jgi:hypothetical protein